MNRAVFDDGAVQRMDKYVNGSMKPFNTQPFTSDYKRIGPDIHGNDVAENTTNGLAIRITTLSGDHLQELETFGRFDDYGITHVIQENLVILHQRM